MIVLLRFALLTGALFVFTACITNERGDGGESGNGGRVAPPNGSGFDEPAIRAVELVQVRWRKIDENPVSYVPADFPRENPTGATDGEWIIDHEGGANYFVPFNGVGEASYSHILASIPPQGAAPELAKDLNVADVATVGTTGAN